MQDIHPIFRAIQDNNISLVNDIINTADFYINIKNVFGYTPIHFAVSQNNIEIFKILFEKNPDLNILNNSKNNPLHTAIQFLYKEIFDILITSDININQQNVGQSTPLHLACELQFNHSTLGSDIYHIVKKLLEKGANPNLSNDCGETSIMILSKLSPSPMLELLLNNGAQVDLQDDNGNTALHHAISYHEIENFNTLLSYKPNMNLINS